MCNGLVFAKYYLATINSFIDVPFHPSPSVLAKWVSNPASFAQPWAFCPHMIGETAPSLPLTSESSFPVSQRRGKQSIPHLPSTTNNGAIEEAILSVAHGLASHYRAFTVVPILAKFSFRLNAAGLLENKCSLFWVWLQIFYTTKQ